MGMPNETHMAELSWDIHAHAIPWEVVHAATLGKYGMGFVANNVLAVKSEQVKLAGLIGVNRNSEALSKLADRVVLSVPPALLRYDLDKEETMEWTDLINDGLQRICASNHNFLGLAYLPLHRPELAVREVERRRGEPWFGFVIGTTVSDKLLDDPMLDIVYQALNECRGFVFVHPLRSPDDRLNRYYLENLLGNPTETGLAIASLIFSGKFIEYPNIRFCFSHGGGVAAQLIGRWQRGYDTSRPGIKQMAVEPQNLMKQIFVDNVVHDFRVLCLCIEVFGADHVLPGTDYPFPMGQYLDSQVMMHLPDSTREMILYRNVLTLRQK